MRSDEFLKNVMEVGGLTDPESAAFATRTILDNLGKRLKDGEATDLAAQLPTELQEPLTRHSDSETVLDDADDFLRRVADELGQGVDPDTAGAYVRAVLSTLAATVSEGEVADVQSQLPAGFASFFED